MHHYAEAEFDLGVQSAVISHYHYITFHFGTSVPRKKAYTSQDSLSIRRTSDASFHIQYHTGEEECPSPQLLTCLCELSEVEQFANWHTPSCEKNLV
jgi:hypothetical protein